MGIRNLFYVALLKNLKGGYCMQYLLIFIIGILFFIEIDKLKKQVKNQQKQMDALCEKTGNYSLLSYSISDEEKELIFHLKNSGKEVEAVKKVRELTHMGLEEAKQYVDTLEI